MRLIFFFFYLISIIPGFTQDKLINTIYDNATSLSSNRYQQENTRDFILLESAFSEGSVEKVPIKEQRITRIDLVYTAYRESSEFSQEALNKLRLKKLIENNPQLVQNRFFEWRLIEQTGCNDPQSCKSFFHGFVVYYDKYYTKEDMKQEIDTIQQNMRELEYNISRYDSLKRYEVHDLTCAFPPLNVSQQTLSDEFKQYYQCDERFNGKIFFDVSVDDKGRPQEVDIKGTQFPCIKITENILKYILRWKRGITIDGKSFPFTAKGTITFPLSRECVTITDYVPLPEVARRYNMEIRGFNCYTYVVDSFYTDIIPKIHKKAVSSVLFRNQWEDDLIIVDATGSMYPYTADLLKWIRLNPTETKTYIFFNDGDDKPTQHKVIGKTGGIYHIQSSNYLDVKEMLFQSMRKGGGGDLYENNFEALLYGVNLTGNTTGAIMIADNHSFPRDHELLKGYSGNLKIILCGTERGVNTNYLNLAYHYGFSIHTLTSDLTNLQNLKSGQSIKIDQTSYVLGSNGFEALIQ
tara:strand:- start:108996 stop:110561 length:1566 start_codon:yes stop_codon:yes gene_type:complete